MTELVLRIRDPLDQEIATALQAADRPGATAADRAALRAALDRHPDAWRACGDLARIAQAQFTDCYRSTASVYESLEHGIHQMRHDLGYDTASTVEQLAIELIITSWLDYCNTTIVSTQGRNAESEAARRRLSAAQQRYTRALETFARVRRMLRLPVMQVNLAAPGSQQVNVAGELHA